MKPGIEIEIGGGVGQLLTGHFENVKGFAHLVADKDPDLAGRRIKDPLQEHEKRNRENAVVHR